MVIAVMNNSINIAMAGAATGRVCRDISCLLRNLEPASIERIHIDCPDHSACPSPDVNKHNFQDIAFPIRFSYQDISTRTSPDNFSNQPIRIGEVSVNL